MHCKLETIVAVSAEDVNLSKEQCDEVGLGLHTHFNWNINMS